MEEDRPRNNVHLDNELRAQKSKPDASFEQQGDSKVARTSASAMIAKPND